MAKIEIGLGFVIAALGGFDVLESFYASIAIVAIGTVLVLHGCYEVFVKPHAFLQRRLSRWLAKRNWTIRVDERPGFYFVIWAQDESHRHIVLSRDKKDRGVLAFTAPIYGDKPAMPDLSRLTHIQRRELIEDIRVLCASKDMGYDGADWPLNRLTIQHALPLDQQLSEHVVDLKAKEVINTVIGVRSLIRKALLHTEAEATGG